MDARPKKIQTKQEFHAQEWREVLLGDVATIIVSNVDKKKRNGEQPVRLCNYTDVYNRDSIEPSQKFMEATATLAQIKKFGIHVGDVIITKDSETTNDIAMPTYVAETADDLVCGYHLAIVRHGKEIDGRFLKSYFELPRTRYYFGSRANGVTRFGLTIEGIKRAKLHLPPIAEQRKIAKILSTWDQAIETTNTLLATARNLKRSLMQSLLTGKRRFPEFKRQVWREVKLSDVATVDVDSLGSNTPDDFEFDYISISNVEFGRIVGPLERLTLGEAPTRARRKVKSGDLLVSTVRPNLLGFARVSDNYANCIASTGFAVVSPGSQCNSSYLFHYLFCHHIMSQFHALVVGSNYPAINSSDTKKLRLKLPPVKEQKQIGQVLDDWDAEINALIDDIEKLRTEKKALMQQLLTGKRRVTI